MSEEIENLRGEIAKALAKIDCLFNVPVKISLMVRVPGMEDANIFVSNDDRDLLVEAIETLTSDEANRDEEIEVNGVPIMSMEATANIACVHCDSVETYLVGGGRLIPECRVCGKPVAV